MYIFWSVLWVSQRKYKLWAILSMSTLSPRFEVVISSIPFVTASRLSCAATTIGRPVSRAQSCRPLQMAFSSYVRLSLDASELITWI